MIFNQTLAGAGGGSSAATHSVEVRNVSDDSVTVYDKDSDTWVSILTAKAGEFVLCHVVINGSFYGMYLTDQYNVSREELQEHVVNMGFKATNGKFAITITDYYYAVLMPDYDIHICIDSGGGGGGN